MSLSKTFLAVSIAVVFTAFVAYTLATVYEAPKDYSQNDCHIKHDCYSKVRECEMQFINETESERSFPIPVEAQGCYSNITKTPEYRACMEQQEECNREFQRNSPQYAYARNSFFILLIIGIAAIVGGSAASKKLEGIGSGFIGGGVLLILWSLIYSSSFVFNLGRYFKVAGLAIVLALLIYIGYKKLDRPGN